MGLASLSGSRNLKGSDFAVGNKLGEGSFGVVYAGAIVPNNAPNRGLLDPDYCPPELYVLPEETPRPPPEPIAALLSPILWQLNSPDLFDMYSAGVVLFTILDLDSGRGWDLATKLISERGFLRRGRLSAAAALRHPYFLLGGDQAAAVLSKLSLTK